MPKLLDINLTPTKEYSGRFAPEATALMGNLQTLRKRKYVSKGNTAIALAQAATRKNNPDQVYGSFEAVVEPYKGPRRTYGPSGVMTYASTLREKVDAAQIHSDYDKANTLLSESPKPMFTDEIEEMAADLTALATGYNQPIETVFAEFDALRDKKILGETYPETNSAYITLTGFTRQAGESTVAELMKEVVRVRETENPHSPWQDPESVVLMGILSHISGNPQADYHDYQALERNPNFSKYKFDKFMDKGKIIFLMFCKMTRSNFDDAFDLYGQILNSKSVTNDWDALQLMLSLASVRQRVDMVTQKYSTLTNEGTTGIIPTFTPITLATGATIYAPGGIYYETGKEWKDSLTLHLFSDPRQ